MLTSAVRSSLKARLERYIVSDDVQISDISDTGMLFHVFGKAIPHACRGWSDISASRLGLPGIDRYMGSFNPGGYLPHRRLTQAGILEATTELFEPFRIAQGNQYGEVKFLKKRFLQRQASTGLQ